MYHPQSHASCTENWLSDLRFCFSSERIMVLKEDQTESLLILWRLTTNDCLQITCIIKCPSNELTFDPFMLQKWYLRDFPRHPCIPLCSGTSSWVTAVATYCMDKSGHAHVSIQLWNDGIHACWEMLVCLPPVWGHLVLPPCDFTYCPVMTVLTS